MDLRIKVLVVEDEPIIAADVSKKLDHLGYEVSAIASRADEAFLAASAVHPDVVLMDINLGDATDGIEAATRISTDLDIPVVFLTAHADTETLQRAQGADPFGYLTKPATSVDLANSIQIALTRHRKQQSHRLREIWLGAQLESVGEGLIAAGQDGTIRFINVEGERLLGLSGVDIRGRSFTSAVPLRHRITGEPIQDLVRLAFLHGATMNIGEDYVVDQPAERKISGEIAISRVAGEAIGIVFTFRDGTVQSYSRNSLCHDLVKSDDSDCTRTLVNLNQVLREMEPVLVAKLSSGGGQLKMLTGESVRPILGNRQLIETVLLGLVGKAQETLGRRGAIRISTANSDFEQHQISGNTARYVRLQVAYRGSGVPTDERSARERMHHEELSIDITLARVQSALQSLQGTAQLGSSRGWSYWDIDFPSITPIPMGRSSESAMVILIEPDAVVRNVVCGYLTGDVYECLGARDAQEALDWTRIFPGQVRILILPEEANSPDIETLLEESPATSVLLVVKNKRPTRKLLGGCVVPNDVIDCLFSQAALRESLDRLSLARCAVSGQSIGEIQSA